ncbi:hypothetical protein D9M71_766950 [compost metagenome]
MIGMGIKGRVRQYDYLRPGTQQQGLQICQQVVPGWRAIDIARQAKRVQLAKYPGVVQIRFPRAYRLGGRCLHGFQLQAEIAQLHAMV